MEISDVKLILDTYHSKDWSEHYELHCENWKKNTWFKIGNTKEFQFVKELINHDLKSIDVNYNVTDWITFLIYEKDDFFGVHTDDTFDYKNSNKQLIYTGGYILNKNFKGGDFIVNNEKLETNVGELFLFERHLKHEVLKIEKGVRYSLHFGVEKEIKKLLI